MNEDDVIVAEANALMEQLRTRGISGAWKRLGWGVSQFKRFRETFGPEWLRGFIDEARQMLELADDPRGPLTGALERAATSRTEEEQRTWDAWQSVGSSDERRLLASLLRAQTVGNSTQLAVLRSFTKLTAETSRAATATTSQAASAASSAASADEMLHAANRRALMGSVVGVIGVIVSILTFLFKD